VELSGKVLEVASGGRREEVRAGEQKRGQVVVGGDNTSTKKISERETATTPLH